jgi:protein-tyrosine-phosphatase
MSTTSQRLRVAVIGSQSPDRSAILAGLLLDSIARHGWSERVEVVGAGVGAGAGRLDTATLAAAGIAMTEELGRGCPDVEEEPDTLEESDVVVVPTGEDADFLISWPEADGKQIFALSDFLGEDGGAIVDPRAPIGEYVSQVREGVPLLLRALVADPR